jgi:hypothetical protein
MDIMDTMDIMDLREVRAARRVGRVKASLPYEIAAAVFALVGAFLFAWCGMRDVDLIFIGFGLFVLGVSWRFNVVAKRLKREGR